MQLTKGSFIAGEVWIQALVERELGIAESWN
jgi:hypothetical protein